MGGPGEAVICTVPKPLRVQEDPILRPIAKKPERSGRVFDIGSVLRAGQDPGARVCLSPMASGLSTEERNRAGWLSMCVGNQGRDMWDREGTSEGDLAGMRGEAVVRGVARHPAVPSLRARSAQICWPSGRPCNPRFDRTGHKLYFTAVPGVKGQHRKGAGLSPALLESSGLVLHHRQLNLICLI